MNVDRWTYVMNMDRWNMVMQNVLNTFLFYGLHLGFNHMAGAKDTLPRMGNEILCLIHSHLIKSFRTLFIPKTMQRSGRCRDKRHSVLP